MVVSPSKTSSSSQTIKGIGATNSGLGSTVRVKLTLDIKQAVTKGSLFWTSSRIKKVISSTTVYGFGKAFTPVSASSWEVW